MNIIGKVCWKAYLTPPVLEVGEEVSKGNKLQGQCKWQCSGDTAHHLDHMAALSRGHLLHHGNLFQEVLHLSFICTSYSNRDVERGESTWHSPIQTSTNSTINFIVNILCTFQKFDGHYVWCFSTPCLSRYVPLGWCHGNIHGECTFVDLPIVPFSQFGSYFEVGAE